MNSNYLRLGRMVIARSFATAIITGGAQAIYIRHKYNVGEKLSIPEGPTFGRTKRESFFHKLNSLKEELREKKIEDFISENLTDKIFNITAEKIIKLEEHIKRIKQSTALAFDSMFMEKMAKIYENKTVLKNCWSKIKIIKSSDEDKNFPVNSAKERRSIRLKVIGDSLVCGIGCSADDRSGPVLPIVLAKLLSILLNADVEWESHGLVGATAVDIRQTLVPKAFSTSGTCGEHKSMTSEETNLSPQFIDESVVENIVVVICGLNDWKTLFTLFPMGLGPNGFRNELTRIVDDIKLATRGQSCKIFLPALPMACGVSDADCIFTRYPLKFFVDGINGLWDLQKKAVSQSHFIEQPSSFSFPETGNISADGVHPSSQGYKYWAMHIAKEIVFALWMNA